jgi:hypothetical protein
MLAVSAIVQRSSRPRSYRRYTVLNTSGCTQHPARSGLGDAVCARVWVNALLIFDAVEAQVLFFWLITWTPSVTSAGNV